MDGVERIRKAARAQPIIAPARGEAKFLTRPTRVSKKKDAVLDTALDVFATYSFHGASLDKIAERARISKANLLYHFGSKEELYVAVLRRILATWLQPLSMIERDQDPVEALSAYIRLKMQYSRDYPLASRLFCLEIVQGASLLMGELSGPLRALVDEKAKVLQGWIDDGHLAPVSPYHLIFSLWAITQHYADFAVQIDAVVGRGLDEPAYFDAAVESVLSLVVNGVRPRPAAPARPRETAGRKR